MFAIITYWVCFGTLAQRNNISRETINKFLDDMPEGDDIYKIYDINLRQNYYNIDIIENSLNKCNILKINDEEVKVINDLLKINANDIETFAETIKYEYNINIIIVTCGENGSYIFADNHKSFKETPSVIVKDTVGAGDSFTAAFCASLLKDKSLLEAHENAISVSAYICTQTLAMPGLPKELVIFCFITFYFICRCVFTICCN